MWLRMSIFEQTKWVVFTICLWVSHVPNEQQLTTTTINIRERGEKRERQRMTYQQNPCTESH